MHPHAFQCDQGTEFLNDNLTQWLTEQGIELQVTAPYSPSQNSAAKGLNCTLVELACAMMIAQDVPAFLWEYAIQHAVYLREWVPARSLPDMTPYEAWHKVKPDTLHLWEFRTPVYILLQGQKKQSKLLPRSKQHIFIGYDDGSRSVKYYNPETRKVLTSRNFQFLTNLLRIELGWVWVTEGVREKEWNTLEELRSRREAERTWLQLVHCALVHTVSYFEKPIRQKRKQGEPKLIFRLEIWEETSEYIYILTMCFIWNKSREIGNGDHKVEYRRGIWTGMGIRCCLK